MTHQGSFLINFTCPLPEFLPLTPGEELSLPVFLLVFYPPELITSLGDFLPKMLASSIGRRFS